MSELDVSVIVPTLNEAANLPLLVPQVAEALSGWSFEIIVVDDNSSDGTPGICRRLAEQHPLTLVVRAQPKDGLGGAVLDGIRRSRGRLLVVMDADLQHPPARIPDLLAPLERDEADFVLGSRYVAGGRVAEKWGATRRFNSWLATLLARPFAGKVSDPMSGFFALPRAVFDRADRLMPLGYKVGLELMCKCRVRRVVEVPIHFAARAAGQSKLTVAEQFRYLEHLSRLYDFCYPRLSPIVKFTIVTTVTWCVAILAFLLLATRLHVRPLSATVISYAAVILGTAVFHGRYVRSQREFLLGAHPWRDFWLSAALEWLSVLVVAWYIARRIEGPYLVELLLIPFSTALVVRYALRKELLLDVRGLRLDREPRRKELS